LYIANTQSYSGAAEGVDQLGNNVLNRNVCRFFLQLLSQDPFGEGAIFYHLMIILLINLAGAAAYVNVVWDTLTDLSYVTGTL